MKRRSFFSSVLGAIASLALAQSIALAKPEKLLGPRVVGYTLMTTYTSSIGYGEGKSVSYDERAEGPFRMGVKRFINDKGWITAERFDGTLEPIVEVPKPGDGRTMEFTVLHDDGTPGMSVHFS